MCMYSSFEALNLYSDIIYMFYYYNFYNCFKWHMNLSYDFEFILNYFYSFMYKYQLILINIIPISTRYLMVITYAPEQYIV